MTLRSKNQGLLNPQGVQLKPLEVSKLRDIFNKRRKRQPGLLAPPSGSGNILTTVNLESASNPTPFVLTPGSTGV